MAEGAAVDDDLVDVECEDDFIEMVSGTDEAVQTKEQQVALDKHFAENKKLQEKLARNVKLRKVFETSLQKLQEKMQQGQNNMNFRYALETLSNKIKLSKVQEKIMASTIRQLEKEELLYFKN